MRTLSRVGIFVLLLVFALSGTAIAKDKSGGDVSAGRLKASTCMGCHGVPTYDRAYPSYDVPKLGGQHAQYLAKALRDYRSGKRNFPTMHAQASTLNKQDVADIAAFLSQKKGQTEADFTINDTHEKGQELAKRCAACHGKGGHSTQPTFPILAGQYKSYLIQALKDYRSGRRKSAVMNGMAASLGDHEIEQIAAYFSSQETHLYTPSVER